MVSQLAHQGTLDGDATEFQPDATTKFTRAERRTTGLRPMECHRFAMEVLMTATATRPSPGPTPATVPSLTEHLASHGLREFTDARKHRRWMRGKIGPERCWTIDWYRGVIAYGDPESRAAMYDVIGAPGVFGPVASERYGAMHASAEVVLPFLPATGRILDVGCATGVLTAWWAMHRPRATFIGCDNTPVAVLTANEEGTYPANVSFVVADAIVGLPEGPFDLVISTQSVAENSYDLPDVLGHIASVLTHGGAYLAVEPLLTVRGVQTFAKLASDAGMVLQSLDMVPYRMFGALQAYPVFEFRRVDDADGSPIASPVDIAEAYATAYRAIFEEEPPAPTKSAGSPA